MTIVSIKQLLETIAPDYQVECPDIPLGTVGVLSKGIFPIL